MAIGAPVKAYMPTVASKLNTKLLIIPDYAHVANAYGAATAGIAQRSRAIIRMQEGGLIFRAHLPGSVADFENLDEAKAYAKEQLNTYVIRQAPECGCNEYKS